MRDDNGRDISWGSLARDLRVWLGIASGVAASLGAVLIAGQDIIRAPALAAQANSTARAALELAEDNRQEREDFNQALRIAFCTKPDFLTAEGRASLQCWRIEVGQSSGLLRPE